MIISLVSIVLVLLIALAWVRYGFFSALIHLVSTLIAGAIAFAAWEPLSLWLLTVVDKPTEWLPGSAWAIGLVLPFVVALFLVRGTLDRIIRANVKVLPVVDYIGGGVLGLASGVISTGILVVGLSYLRVDYVDSQSFVSEGTGSVRREGGLWVPFDKITVAFYGHLSERALSTSEPLARWRFAAHEQGNANRMSPFDGKGRNTFRPGDFEVRARFTVGAGGGNFSDLTRDMWNPNPQHVTDPDGQPFPPGTHIEGFVVMLKPGAREKDGQAAMGNAQVQLIVENDRGERKMFFPFAVSAPADPATPGVARFRYDAANVFIATVGGSSESMFAFEFPCPPGFRPIALYVKGVRVRVDQGPLSQAQFKFASAAERDSGLMAMGMGTLAAPVGAAGMTPPGTTVRPDGVIVIGDGRPRSTGFPEGMIASLRLPWGMTLQAGLVQGLDIDESGGSNIIQGGECRLNKSKLPAYLTEKNLRIEQFLADRTTVLVQLEVGPGSRTSLLGGAVTAAENVLPPMLVDTQGEQYQPIGYVYQDESDVWIRFSPGEPIRAMSQLPSLSRSRPAQKMVLLFRVSLGREVKSFMKGGKVICEFDPPVKLDQPQSNR
jgi:hypothetical protein